ncbi:Uridine nucleosidase 1 [Lecanora helva]
MVSIEPGVPLWLDCDTECLSFGIDFNTQDAFAILLAGHHPSLNLLGVSTVHGNASLEQTTTNTLSILTAIGRTDVPVHPGAAKPFCRAAVHAPNIHGNTGLDGTTCLPSPGAQPIQRPNAVLAIRHALMEQPKKTAWVVATGALTNVALLFATFPELVQHIKGLSIMGGAVGGGFTDAPMGKVKGEGERFGNHTRWAEFNIYCDPEAAESIFSNPELAAKTTLIPLDLTHQVLADKTVQQKLLNNPFSSQQPNQLNIRQLFNEILTFFAHTYHEVFAISEGPPLHDPIAVAVLLNDLIDGGLFDDRGGERWHVEVVTDGQHSDSEHLQGQVGRTNIAPPDERSDGVRIPRSMDVPKFWSIIAVCLSRAEEVVLFPPASGGESP